MTDYTQEPATPPLVAAPVVEPPVSAALIVYALYTLAGVIALATAGTHTAPLLSTVGVIGLIIAYVKRGEAAGTWVASHMAYLIRTFWWALGISVLGFLFAITFIGLPIAWLIWFGAAVWILYRAVRGYLYFKDSKPLPMN